MKSSGFWPSIAIVVLISAGAVAQSEPNLEVGFKPYGTYHGSEIDSVNLMNGNVTLHVPLPFDYPQRGGKIHNQTFLLANSKQWQVKGIQFGNSVVFSWVPNGWNMQVPSTSGRPSLSRFFSMSSAGTTAQSAQGYSVATPDGGSHPLVNISATSLEAVDGSGWHATLSNVDADGVPMSSLLIDRNGTQYVMWNFIADCPEGGSSKGCTQNTFPTTITDANGNVYTFPSGANGADTMGRSIATVTGLPNGIVLGSDSAGCPTTVPFVQSQTLSYAGAGGATNQIKFCLGSFNTQTNFAVSGVQEYPNSAVGTGTTDAIAAMILPDGSTWTFTYDSYENPISVGLPLGGSITYQWTTALLPVLNANTPASRAVSQRTITDNNGHSYVWKYQWMVSQSSPGKPGGTYTNVVTDPLGNDSVHVFTNLAGLGFYETRSQSYQGSYTSGTLLEQVDTGYLTYALTDGNLITGEDLGAFPNSIQTTLPPSGKVKLVQKTYDSALATTAGQTGSYGKVVTEKEYDWGQGAPGALLRETDTTYQWQNNSAYLAANLLDLPAVVVIKDGNGNKLAETDYTYDESAYLSSSNISTQHGAAPSGSVRGNPSTVSRWVNTGGTVVTHTNWFDTGVPYQQLDALGNATTHSYDPFYVGAYPTETCNAVSQCVSATYDFTTGLLTSFTNANATTQASGNTPGDSAHTSNYGYDFMSRMTSAAFPPDPDSGGAQAQTTFQYPNPISLPFTVTKTRSITSSLSDTVTSYFDGLGRVYKTLHPLSNGTAEVDTGYDGLDHVVSVTNPYFSTSDPTYGVMQTQFDGLGRTAQVTKQDGSVSTVAYDFVPLQGAPGDCTKSTDEAGKQRLGCADGLGRLIEVHEPGDNFSGSQAQGSFNVSGSLQSYLVPGTNATYSTGSVTISGADQAHVVPPQRQCNSHGCVTIPGYTTWDFGTVTITINGVAFTQNYGNSGNSGTALSTLASNFQSAINNGSSVVQVTSVTLNSSASPPNAVLALQARNAGALTFSLSGSSAYDTALFSSPSFTVATSGSVTGGTNGIAPQTVYDQGTVTVTIGAFTASAAYSQGGNSTAAQVASALAGNGPTGLNRSGSPVTASASGATLTITYASIGPGGDVMVSCSSSTSVTQYFSAASFTCPSSTALGGGYNPEGPSLDFNYFLTQYSYDALGNLLNVTQKGDPSVSSQGQWRTRTFTYNSLSQLLTATNPESGTISYSYDTNGNVLTKTSPAPNQTGSTTQTLSYCYDALNRVTGKAYSAQSCSNGLLPSGTAVVTYSYDAGLNGIGHLTSLTDQAGSGSYSYDVLGRLASEQRTIAGNQKNLSYTYNLDHSVASLTYPSGAVVTYTPDSAGRVLSAIDSGNNINYVTGATYGPDSSLTGFISGNSGSFSGITNQWQYNPRLQICRITALTTGTLPKSCTDATDTGNLLDLGYNMNLGAGDNGNVAAITNYKDTTRSQSFTYDALNRLTSAQNAGTNCSQKTSAGATEYWGNSYGYDAWGNLLQKTPTKCLAENLSVTALANNQLSGYGYDAAGNMTHDASTGNNYTFDAENRITGAAGYTYTYDADGNRVEKSNGSTGTIYWYMTPGIVAESDLSGNPKSEYVFFDGERVARKDFPSNAVSYYFSDHLKTASVITDSGGNIKEDEDYYPWGGEIQFVNGDTNHYKFTGKERDAESGLDYFGARYYGNWLGRFMSADWAAKATAVPYATFGDPQSLNLYSYVRNNPLARIDPDGHCPSDDGCSGVTVAVTVTEQPQMMQDVKLGPNTYFSGVGGTLSIKFTDSKGNPIKGTPVKESNTSSGGKTTENPNPVKTSDKGTISDVVGKGFTESTPTQTSQDMQEGKQVLTTTPINSTSTQTLTFTATDSKGQPCTCQASYDRTLRNTDSNGNLNTQNNSNGVNYTLTTTQPTVKPVQQQPAQQPSPQKKDPQ